MFVLQLLKHLFPTSDSRRSRIFMSFLDTGKLSPNQAQGFHPRENKRLCFIAYKRFIPPRIHSGEPVRNSDPTGEIVRNFYVPNPRMLHPCRNLCL